MVILIILISGDHKRYLDIKIEMGRILKGFAVFGGVLFLVPPLRNHLDQKIWKHVRNYNTTLSQKNRFNTQEEFY